MKKRAAKKLRSRRVIDISAFSVAAILVAFGVWQALNPSQPICAQAGQEHQLEVRGDEFSQKDLSLQQCDVIKIVNFDSQNYLFAFGVHEKHVDYPGFGQQLVAPNEFIVIDALQSGNFRIHDHLRDKAAIELTIQPKN